MIFVASIPHLSFMRKEAKKNVIVVVSLIAIAIWVFVFLNSMGLVGSFDFPFSILSSQSVNAASESMFAIGVGP